MRQPKRNNKEELDDIATYSQSDVQDAIEQHVIAGMRFPTDVKVTQSLWEDSELFVWVNDSMRSLGGKQMARQILQHPTAHIALLRHRQDAMRSVATLERHSLLHDFVGVENDLHWLITRTPISGSTSLQLLYPSFFALRFVNHIPILLAMLHIYKGYVAPFTNILTPLSTIFGPYFYLKRTMGASITLPTYVKLCSSLASKLFKPTGNLRTDATKFGTMGMYIGMFAIGLVQSIELAGTVRKVHRLVTKKTEKIREFVATNFSLIQQVPPNVWHAYGIEGDELEFQCLKQLPRGAHFMYKYLSDTQLQRGFYALLRRMYVVDTLSSFRKLLARNDACMAVFDAHTKFYHMGHINLPSTQVRNPCSLQRSLLITGPNAGGKTTYVKSICANYILAQTLGIAVAQRAVVQPQHAFGSFMRIHDEVGNKSLFEAEVVRCAEIVAHAKQMSDAGKNAIYFLDEPMHSTPPAEGASASIATVEYLGKLKGIRVVVTTHFFQLTQLASDYPLSFQNVSMEAIPTPNGFTFPYRIRNGPSFQCIALELLRENMIPSELISRAIKWKNKICSVHVK